MRKTAVSKLARTAGLLTLGLLLATLVPHAGNAGTTSLGANLQLATPQGAGASREHGDYVSRGDALGTYYSFFFEVPPGLDRLVIDLFDADIGIGGSAEHAAGRDRARSAWDTSVTYSLFDPNGDPVLFPRFTTGDASSPAGADGAWLTFCDTDDTGAPWLRAWSLNTVNEQEAIELEIPDETAEDDLLIAVIARDADSNSHTNITAPVGWTELNQGH
ncbi:MAG: hypothetical protein KBI26_11450, partial [Thermoanaerobaculia bacterium]|nr:hypothetical protein [Thermoanaerobaculia bacterium]